jgi:hypothetical protein
MFSGLTGLAFAGWSLSREGDRYQRLLTAIEDTLLPRVIEQANSMTRTMMEGAPFAEFDVISGLAGEAAYLLRRRGDAHAAAALEAALVALIALTGGSDRVPRWWTPSHFVGDEQASALYPHGNLNCGLAHGIPGPLSVLALALSSGVVLSGLEDAVDRLADWLVDHQIADAWGVNWPYAVPLSADGLEDRAAASPSRAAWCYGSPGVARALWLAGAARGRSDWSELAIVAMEAVYKRPIAARIVDSPTFCHGVAGLLQITLRFANDTKLPAFTTAAMNLTEQLLAAYEPG